MNFFLSKSTKNDILKNIYIYIFLISSNERYNNYDDIKNIIKTCHVFRNIFSWFSWLYVNSLDICYV